MNATRLKSLAGVQIPSTKLTNAAVDLLEATSPQFLFNHCLRTYVFGSLAVRPAGRGTIDEEIAFCGAAFRDLLVAHCRANPAAQVDRRRRAHQRVYFAW